MTRPSPVPESSMEEILASIRKIISEDESKVADGPGAEAAPTVRRPAGNVSRLFGGPLESAIVAGTEKDLPPPVGEKKATAAEFTDWPSVAEPGDGVFANGPGWSGSDQAPAVEPDPPPDIPPDGSFLSAAADAAVASALDRLASTMPKSKPRTVEQLAEDMMRPVLKEWLDDNLPRLVERLVREEIERISRRR